MSLFDLFSSKPNQFVSEEQFRENLTKQVAWAPKTIEQLRKHGVTDQSFLKLEFFFYTNETSKAGSLAKKLNDRGYSAKFRPSAKDKKVQVINGWTDKMQMTDAIVANWSRQMCELGHLDDCHFDGWGTNPKQST